MTDLVPANGHAAGPFAAHPPDMREAALALAAAGLRLFPAHTPGPDGCSCADGAACDKPGKHPRIKGWQQAATVDTHFLNRWWRQWPTANIGTPLGAGVLAVDFDGPAGLAWAADHADLVPAATWTTITPGGGQHRFYRVPRDLRFRNWVKQAAHPFDIRTDGGLVILPPSLHANGKRYAWVPGHGPDTALADAPPALIALLTPPERTPRPVRAAGDDSGPEGINPGLIKFAEAGKGEGERDSAGLWLACRLVESVADERAGRAVLDLFGDRCIPPYPRSELDRLWDQAHKYEDYDPAKAWHLAAPRSARPAPAPLPATGGGDVVNVETGEITTTDDDGRPIIAVNGEMHQVRRQILEALAAANGDAPSLFQRGRQLVRVVYVHVGGHRQGMLEPYTADSLRPRIGEVAAMQRYDSRAKQWYPTDARRDQVAAVLVADHFPFPVLDGIAEVPFVRPDGTLHDTPGYDAATRLIYQPAPGLVVPPIPEAPTAEQVAAARTLLCDDLLGDFPFAGPAERAHAVACLLLPFVRSLIAGPTPLHMFESPTPGSGKSLLAEVLLSLAFGNNLAADSDKRDEDEARKWISAKVQEGASVLWIDNIKHGIDNAVIAKALTSIHWTDRVLGSTNTITGPLRAVWVGTANNPSLSMEMARRVVRCRIDPKVDRPHLRSGFQHPDLRAWARAHRGELVGAALTLVRAWVAAGRPDGGGRLGSFEEWSAILSGILQVAGIPGFLGNLLESYDAADTEGAQWRALIGAWWTKYGAGAVSSSQLFELANEIDGFDFGKGREGKGASVAFGKALAKQRDRCYGPLRVTCPPKQHGLARYALVLLDPDPASVDVYFGVDPESRAQNLAADPASPIDSTTIDSTILGDLKSTPIYTSTPPMPGIPCTECGEYLWAWSDRAKAWLCSICLPSVLEEGEDPADG